MQISVKPFILRGKTFVPSSKSLSHRYLIAAALAGDISLVSNVNECYDVLATRRCLQVLGTNNFFECGDSASTLRFFLPLSLVYNDKAFFIGSKRLLKRGINVYKKCLEHHGIKFLFENDKIFVQGKLKAGNFIIDGSESSQYISGLLFALPLLSGDSTLKILSYIVSKPYIDMTLAVLKTFDIEIIQKSENEFFIKGKQKYKNRRVIVDGDWTNAIVLYAFKLLNKDLIVENVQSTIVQGDKVGLEFLKKLQVDNAKIDLINNPDLAPVLFVVAGLLNGGIFYGVERLQNKESNRLDDMIAEMAKFGIETEKGKNSLRVYKAEKLHKPQVPVESHNDHRIVMAMMLLLSNTGGMLNNAEAVYKSWPTFFEEMQYLGADLEMRV